MEEFETIYRTYYKTVYFYIYDLCRNQTIAEDVTQETFYKVMAKIDTFKGECSLSTWMIQIAKNTYFGYLRKKKLEEKYETEILPESESFEEKIVNKETAVEIHKLLHKLKDPYKEVFWMRTFGELSFAEIAEIHGKTENWARVTYYRAKEQIDISDLR